MLFPAPPAICSCMVALAFPVNFKFQSLPQEKKEVRFNELMTAIHLGKLEAVKQLVSVDLSILSHRNPAGVTPIMLAAYIEKPEILAYLASKRGRPDFFEAILTGDAEALREALARGQDVNAFSPDGFSPLGLAVFFRQPTFVRLLLDAGADPNIVARNSLRTGPVHAAVARGDNTTLALLLERGADPNIPQSKRVLPLHDAAVSGNTAAVALLLMFGADRNARTEEGHTSADLARQKGFHQLAQRLAALPAK